MSIFSMAEDTAVRTARAQAVRPAAALSADEVLRSGEAAPAPAVAQPAAPGDTTLEAFTKYIPAETISLYLAALAAVNNDWNWGRNLFLIMAVATPILVLLLTYIQVRSKLPLEQQRETRVVLRQMPPTINGWKMITATVAFVFWASAIPGNPFFMTDGSPTISPVLSSAFVFIGSFVIDFLTKLLFPSGIER